MYRFVSPLIFTRKQSRRTQMTLGPAALLFFLLTAACGAQTDPSGFDVRLFRTINNAQTPLKSSIFDVTDYSLYPMVIAAPVGLTAYGLAANRDQEFESGVLVAASEILSYGVSTILKDGIKRERPYNALSNVNASHVDLADPYSFPSGHTTGAFALAMMLTLRYPRPEVYVPAFMWAGVVGYGRVYLGNHYPSDVLGGALVGIGGSLLVYQYRDKILPLAYRIIGRREPPAFSAIVLPNRGGGLINLVVSF